MLVTSLALHISSAPSAAAVEIPPAGSPFFLQTNGATATLGNGDWYSSSDVGAGDGYHYVQLFIPCGWPTSTPVTVDLFSPEMNTDAGLLAQHEEPAGALDTTTFELYGVGSVVGPGFDQPAAGAGVLLTNYPPAPSGVAETWVRFATIDPSACGTYVIRSATAGDDQNGWRIRVGFDDDANVLTAPVTDLDGVAGTDDELILGQTAVTYQQNSAGNSCIDLFEYVAPGQLTMEVHNFDFDGFDIPGSSINYFSPSNVNVSGTTSTPSATWNVSDLISRGTGDVITDPESGWWRINSCISSGNQMIQEGQLGINAYSEHPPTPQLTVTKTDGRVTAGPGDALTYAVHIANPGDPDFPGAANAVVATDTLPANTTFVSCGFVLPATGTCTELGGVVTATLTGTLNAGAAVDLEVQVSVNGGATGSVTNDVSVAYMDSFGNVFAPVTASDVDTIGTGSIGDFVFLDTNANSFQDAGDVGLAGVDVTVTWFGVDGNLGGGDDVVFNTTTDASGNYVVSGLPAGGYEVQAVAPSGTLVSVGGNPSIVALADAENRTDVDIGFAGTGSIGDTVFLDKNGNGTQDAGDTGLAGVDVAVTWAGLDDTLGNGDDVVFNATTNASGVYAVTDLPAGNYRVDPTGPAGFSNTTVDPLDTTLSAGQNRTDADFGFNGNASVGDFVWFDQNGDGVQDVGEPGLPNVTVTVSCEGPDALPGTADDVVRSTTTNAAGAYVLGALPPGDCIVDVNAATAPPGMVTTTTDPLPVTLSPGQALTTADFGFTGTGSIGDLVFHDANGNGTQDVGDAGIAGVAVELTWAGPDDTFSTSDDVVFNTSTDATGGYLFTALPAGSYSVDPTTPTGFALTTGSDPLPVALGSGQNLLTADFGYRGTASIGDVVFDDQNGSGTEDAGEPGISGVTVTATWAGFDGTLGNGDDLAFTASTNGAGTYTIANLPPGAYSVAVTSGVPAGFVATTSAPISTTLTAGEVEVTDDFGFQQQADLAIAKTTDTPTVVVGDDASWTMTVSNNGPATAVAPIVVTDTLPAGTSFVSATGTDWGCVEAPAGTVTCTYAGVPATLANGGSLPAITITATVTASAALTITNTATVASPTTDTNPNNNTATDDAATQPAADITILKSHAGNFLVGSQGSYSILVGNDGPSSSAGPFIVTDTLPTGLTFVAADGGVTWACGESLGTITCTANGPLANGATLPVITVTVDVTTGAEGGVTNTAVVDPGATLDPDLTNNTDDDPTTVVPVADLAIVKTAPGPFVVGDQAAYALTVTNNGPSAAAGPITVTDNLPTGLTFVSGVGTGWSCSAVGQDITCTHASALALGATSDIAVTVTVDATVGSVIDNTAIVGSPTLDPDPSNNTSTVQTPTTPTIDFAIVKTHTGDFVIGTPGTYTVTVANNGPSTATGTITVHDSLPAGLTPTDANGTGWICNIVAQAVTCASDTDLGSGASLPVITVTVTVTPAAYPSVTNSSTVDTPPGANETILANNTDDDPTIVASQADLAITKIHAADFVVGTDGVYVITVANNGPTEAIGPITVTDTLPGGLGFVSGSGDGFTCVAGGQDVTCTRASALPNGEAAVITLVVSVGTAAEGTIVNHADVSSPSQDPVPANNGDDDTTTVDPDIDLSLEKHVGSGATGSDATWTIIVRNLGQSDAPGPITVTDVLPDGLTFVSGSGEGWSCSAVGQVVTCVHDGPLAAGSSSTITIVTLVTAPPGTAISNTASVSSASSEIVIDNNSATAVITGVASPPAQPALANTGIDASRTATVGGLLIVFGVALSALGDVQLRRRGARCRPRSSRAGVAPRS